MLRKTASALLLAPLALGIAGGLMGAASSARYRAGLHPTVESQIEYGAKAAKAGRAGEAKGYAQALLIGEEIKVRTFFAPESEGQRPEAMRALAAAGETWREALGRTVKIREARSDETPDLTVDFQPDVQLQGRQVSGFIRWRRDVRRTGDGWVGSFEGHVSARTMYAGKPMTFEMMRCCLGHEMGHMFGLPDHDPNDQSDEGSRAIMGPLDVRNPVAAPDETEVETVRHIREDAAGFGATELKALDGTEHQLILELDGTETRSRGR